MARARLRPLGAHVLVSVMVVVGLLVGARSAPATAADTLAAPTNGMIAFLARNNATNAADKIDLMEMNADGTSPRVLVRGAVSKGICGFGLDWSPDGNRIAYADSSGVYVVDANGSNRHRITTYCGGSLSWSPNGNWLAVQGPSQVTFLIHPDGTGAKYLRPDNSGVNFASYDEFDPAFASDGLSVVESTVVIGATDGWGVYGFALTDAHVTRYVSIDLAHPGGIAHSVDVRVDGSRTLLDLGDIKSGPDNSCDPLGANAWIDSNLFTLAAPPDAPLVRIGSTTAQSALRESDGAWSADGQSIVFLANKKTKCNTTSHTEVLSTQAVYSMNTNGTNVKQLYLPPGAVPLVADPHWQACGASTKTCTVATATCNGLAATIVGTSAGETLIGSGANDVIAGLGGRDTITGNGGHDTICGGPGNDTIDGGAGPDALYGNDDDDTVLGGAGTDIVHGNAGIDSIGGGPDGGDQCFGDLGTDKLVASAGCESVSSVP